MSVQLRLRGKGQEIKIQHSTIIKERFIMAINTAKKDEIIEIAPIKLRTISLRIVGDTPMIFHNWS